MDKDAKHGAVPATEDKPADNVETPCDPKAMLAILMSKRAADLTTAPTPLPGVTALVHDKTVTPKPSSADPSPDEGSQKDPVIERVHRGTLVAHHRGNNDISVTSGAMHEAIHVQNCKECTIKVSGKCATIHADRCWRVRFEFDTLIAGMEILNSNQIDIRPRATAVLPSLRVEKCENVIVYLNLGSMECKIIHHVSYPIVLMVPEPSEETPNELCFRPVTIQTMFESIWNPRTNSVDTKPSTYC